MAKTYKVNEVFYSIQGEGVLAGTPMVFLRFSGCNLACDLEAGPKSPGGFVCDTEFESGRRLDLEEIAAWVDEELGDAPPSWLLLTGGEPALQMDEELCRFFKEKGFRLAVETNGSRVLPNLLGADEEELEKRWRESEGGEEKGAAPVDAFLEHFWIDWICVSPKVAEHAIRQRWAHEVKYVRGYGQGIPQTRVRARHQLISPAFAGNQLDPRGLGWCVEMVRSHPSWRLSVQQHKGWRVR